jgi:2-phospho-L-lactate guanylyltransferase
MILIPVKNLSGAKQRLASIADQAARTALAQAMLEDVVSAIANWERHPATALVTSDPFAIDLARAAGFQVIPDTANISETHAIEMATQVCISSGEQWTMVIPADIPLIEAWELERILEAAPEEGSLLVPAADGRGTNAAFRRPCGLFPLRFGNDSFKPHYAAAQATGKPCIVLESPGIALDVDNPEELSRLVATAGHTRAQRLARHWDIAKARLSNDAAPGAAPTNAPSAANE